MVGEVIKKIAAAKKAHAWAWCACLINGCRNRALEVVLEGLKRRMPAWLLRESQQDSPQSNVQKTRFAERAFLVRQFNRHSAAFDDLLMGCKDLQRSQRSCRNKNQVVALRRRRSGVAAEVVGMQLLKLHQERSPRTLNTRRQVPKAGCPGGLSDVEDRSDAEERLQERLQIYRFGFCSS